MHTAEHILNQTMVRMFNCGRSFSNHLEKKKSKCDYHFFRELTPVEEKDIEDRVNDQIMRNLDVTEKIISRDEAGKLFTLERLPEESGDTVRLVYIGDYDVCPCIGEHVCNTSEIGLFSLISSSFEEGILRLRFKLNNK